MTRMRRIRIVLLATAVGVWTAAVTGPLASVSSAEPAGQPGPTAPPRTVALRVQSAMSVAVDPDTRDGKAHHPLALQAQALDINANPLVTSATPTGYDPTTIKKYLGLTGTGY